MPKKLRPKSQRQHRAVASLTQAHQAACSHPCKQSKCRAKSSQARTCCCWYRQNTLHRVSNQVQAVDTSSASYRTYKNSEELRSRVVSGIITPIHEHWDKASVSSPHQELPPATAREVDPLQIRPHHPHTSRQPPWWVVPSRQPCLCSSTHDHPASWPHLWHLYVFNKIVRVLVYGDRKLRHKWDSEFLYCQSP